MYAVYLEKIKKIKGVRGGVKILIKMITISDIICNFAPCSDG